tara:strand:- start:15227 stop:15907 length:681 start_codon:yes stop_codon:yes gene_type:complete
MEVIYEPENGTIIDAIETMYPTLSTWISKDAFMGERSSSCFGYVVNGKATIENEFRWSLQEGNYFALNGKLEFTVEEGSSVWVVEKKGYRCMPMVGTIEKKGRLSYIDGCSDSVLVSMPRMGDPVLNHLHFPTGIYQTQHTHPSIRMGVVIGGGGEAFQEKSNYDDGWVKPLKKGCMFMLEEQELHSFRTTDKHMDIIAFHPDSDTGPTDENHSMINRTYIDHGKG